MDVCTADNIMNLTAFFCMQGVVVMRLDVYGNRLAHRSWFWEDGCGSGGGIGEELVEKC